ncbi:MAG: hypothetical protein HY885_08410 [Deltaproteobacteria bacterium]|nr:hypothetical protein [Deltaproteobacteria bacterium]
MRDNETRWQISIKTGGYGKWCLGVVEKISGKMGRMGEKDKKENPDWQDSISWSSWLAGQIFVPARQVFVAASSLFQGIRV